MENNNGKGIFYGVIGVATLVVAIIGATFAYFSANATLDSSSDNISGTTNNQISTALTLKVTRVNKTVTNAKSIDLVPTNIEATTQSISTAVAANCEASGYTGCHLYKIEANTTQDVAAANIYLDSLTVNSTNTTNWKYAIYTGTDTSATGLVAGGNGSMPVSNQFDMHNGAALTTSGQTYYLLVWIANDTENAQNVEGQNSVLGTYTGTVSMSAGAAGGKVTATFGG